MAILGKLLSDGLEEAGEEIVKKAAKKASKEGGESILAKLGKKIPVSGGDDIAREIAVRNIAKSPYSIDEMYKKLVSYKQNPEVIKKAGQSLIEKEAGTPYRNFILDNYDLAFNNELGKSAGKSIDALRDYAKISTPQELDAAKANMRKFLQSKNSDDIVNASKQFIDNRTPLYGAMNSSDGTRYTTDINAALRAQDSGSDIVKAMPKDDRLIAPQFAERFNPKAPSSEVIGSPSGYSQLLDDVRIQRELKNAENYLPGQKLYHSSPETFTKFDDTKLGSNTGYENTALGHFVTPDEEFSRRFGNNIYEVQANIKNPITHPYGAMRKYSNDEANMLVEDWLRATDNAEGLDYFNQMIKDGEAEDLYDAYMNTLFFDDVDPYEYAADERKLLQDKGFDGVEIVEGPKSGLVDGSADNSPVSSYVALNGSDLDIKNAKKYLPVKSDDAAQSIPVYHGINPELLNDPVFKDIVDRELVKQKGSREDLDMIRAAKRGDVIPAEEAQNSRYVRNLRREEEKIRKSGQYANLTPEMEADPSLITPELKAEMDAIGKKTLDEFHNNPNVKYEREAVIFMGGPSSGKSSAGMKMYDATKGGDFAVLDSDDIKPQLTGFNGGAGATLVHPASAYTAKAIVLPEAASEGMNLAIPIVGKDEAALAYHLDLLNKNGYKTSVVKVDLPEEKAATRNLARTIETGRNVYDDYVRNTVGDKPSEVYQNLVKRVKSGEENRVAGYARLSNDVKFKRKAILQELLPSNTLKRVQNNFPTFDIDNPSSIRKFAEKQLPQFDNDMQTIASELGGEYLSGGAKSIESMKNKVARKQAIGKKDYDYTRVKDHLRGAIMFDDPYTDENVVKGVIERLQSMADGPVTVENLKTDLGYSGIHVTWKGKDGLNRELQITNPEAWPVKLKSDAMYEKIRNWSPEEMDKDPQKMLTYLNIRRESLAMWKELWKKLGYDGEPDLSWVNSL